MKKSSKFLIMALFGCFTVCFIISCSKNKSHAMSFEQLEKELNFVDPLSKTSRERILNEYKTVENYRDFVIQRRQEIRRPETLRLK